MMAVRVGDLEGRLRLDSSQWSRGMAGAREGLDRTSEKMQQFSAAAARWSKRAAVAFGAIGIASVKMASEFETSMTKIITLVGVAEGQVKSWEKSVLDMARKTGRGPKELADALFVVTSAGIKGAEALEVLEQAAKASAVGMGDTAEIARTVTAAVQAYGKENLSASQATDIMMATVREGNLEASSLAGTLGRVIGIAAQMGISFQNVGAFMATFTRLGVSSEEAVTALRGTLTALTGGSDEVTEALKNAGLSMAMLRDVAAKQGLPTALRMIVDAFGDNIEALKLVIPNVRALSGILGTAGAQGDEFARILDSISASTGITDSAFERVQKTSGFAFNKMMASIKATGIMIGTQFLPAVTDAMNGVSSFLKDNLKLFGDIGGYVRIVTAEVKAVLSTFFNGITSAVNFSGLASSKLVAFFLRGIGLMADAVNRIAGTNLPNFADKIAFMEDVASNFSAAIEKDSADMAGAWRNLGNVILDVTNIMAGTRDQTDGLSDAIDNMTDATGDLAVGLGKVNANLIDTATLARRAAAALRSRGMAVTGSEVGLSLPAGRIGAGGASTLGTDPVTARLTPAVTEAVSALQRFKDGLKTVGSNLGDFLKERFNPTQFITDLASGGISAALGFAASKIGEMFGQSEEEAAMAAALESNKISLDRLRGSIDRQANVMSQMPGGIFEAARTAINEAMTWHPWGNLGGFFTIDMKKVREAMDRLGLTMGDLERIAEILNMEFVNTAEGIKALAAALNNLSVSDLFATVSGGLDMLRREFEFRDFTPVRQLQRVRDFLVARAGLGAEGERLQRLDLTTAEGRAELQIIIMSIFERILSGGLALGAMGEFNITEFLDILGWLESLGDSIDGLEEEVDGTTEAFRDLQKELLNVPSGFKIALARFGATTGVLPDTSGTGPGTVRTDPPGGGGGIVPPGMFASIGAASPSSIISVENVTVVAAQGESASDLWARMEAAARKEARRGGTSNLDLAVR